MRGSRVFRRSTRRATVGRRPASAAKTPGRPDKTLRAVVRAIRRAERKGDLVVRVAWLAKTLGRDPRTIRRRLRSLALRYEGAYMDKAESCFALLDVLLRALEKVERAP